MSLRVEGLAATEYTEPRRTLGRHPPVDATLSCRGV